MSNRFDNNPFQGGAGLADGKLASDLKALTNGFVHDLGGILGGGIVTANTCTQAAGTGATTWNVDVAALDVLVNGTYEHENAQTGFVIHETTCLVLDGQSIYVWLLEKNHDGTCTTVAVKGTAATTGDEEIPTNAEIAAALASDETYVKLALLHIDRAGTTLTETIDMTYREEHGAHAMRDF